MSETETRPRRLIFSPRRNRDFEYTNITSTTLITAKNQTLTLLSDRDVNETLGSETETRPRRSIFSPRRDRYRDLPTLCRDRDETETFKFWVQDETETETLRGRDRDVFRDVGTWVWVTLNNLCYFSLTETSILYS